MEEGEGQGQGDGRAIAVAKGTAPVNGWRTRCGSVDIATAFAPGAGRRLAPGDASAVPLRAGEVARVLDIVDGATGRLVMVAAWGGAGAAARAARLVDQADAWIDEARGEWGAAAAPGGGPPRSAREHRRQPHVDGFASARDRTAVRSGGPPVDLSSARRRRRVDPPTPSGAHHPATR